VSSSEHCLTKSLMLIHPARTQIIHPAKRNTLLLLLLTSKQQLTNIFKALCIELMTNESNMHASYSLQPSFILTSTGSTIKNFLLPCILSKADSLIVSNLKTHCISNSNKTLLVYLHLECFELQPVSF
jgi:hypothetical protein